jgi:signal transduction histidine kinase
VSAPGPPAGAAADARLLGDVVRICNRAAGLDEVIAAALERVCTAGGWLLGRLRPLPAEPGPVPGWRGVCWGTPLPALERCDPLGSDRSRALSEGRPVWIPDLEEAAGASAGAAAAAVLLVPVTVGDRPVAVLELFAGEGFDPDAALLELAAQIGIELGRPLERAEHERLISELAEREQQRIGSELHDGVGQQLAALGWLARTLQRRLDAGAALDSDSIGALVHGLEEAQAQLRSLARGLVPPAVDARSLPDALEALVERCRRAAGVDCTFECEEELRIEDAAAPHLFRIAQEALRNAVEHAKASHIVVRLGAGGLEVHDDGVGMGAHAEGDGAGLRIMRRRAALIGAALRIESSRGAGTRIRCVLQDS